MSSTDNAARTDEIKEKLAKLLRHAADRQGTPEGAMFEAKAFELMAKYGVEASQIHQRDSQALRRDQHFTGAYTDLQFRLLNAVADTLHCMVVRYHQYNRRAIHHAVVFGKQQHLDRVFMLFDILNPQMIAGAKRHGDTLWADAAHTRRAKRSWMLGFIDTIQQRLLDIENKHTDQFSQGDKNGELVLLDDAQAAARLAAEHFPYLKTKQMRSNAQLDPWAYNHGLSSGENMDLGQTQVRRRARALPSGS